MQQIVDSQTTNSSAQAIVQKEVPCLKTFDDLSINIVYEINLKWLSLIKPFIDLRKVKKRMCWIIVLQI